MGLGHGVYLVCHTLPAGHLLVGWAVRQPNGGYRMSLPRLLRRYPSPDRDRAGQGHPEAAEDALDGLAFRQRSPALSFHSIVRSYRLPYWAAASSTTPSMSSLTSVPLSSVATLSPFRR